MSERYWFTSRHWQDVDKRGLVFLVFMCALLLALNGGSDAR